MNERGHTYLIISRKPGLNRITWEDVRTAPLPDVDAVINVAGEFFLNPFKWWNDELKLLVTSSRVDTTQAISTAIIKSKNPPKVFISVSGVNYYPQTSDATIDTRYYNEDSKGGVGDFFANLCTKWEKAATIPTDVPVRVAHVRLGVILGKTGVICRTVPCQFYAHSY